MSGKRGGARLGAGRKPKPKAVAPKITPEFEVLAEKAAAPVVFELPRTMNMLEILQAVALGLLDANALQVRAAIAAVQYTHVKRCDGGKKDEKDEAAKKVAGGKFSPSAAPKLALVK